MGQLKDRLADVYDDQIAELIGEAREEALAEAKATIKGMMIQAILERALSQLEGGKEEMEKVAAPKESSPVVAQARESAGEGEEQLRREIEAIKGKIVENERLLSQLEASPIVAQGLQEPPLEDEVSAPVDGGEDPYGYYVYGIVGCDGKQGIEILQGEGIDPADPVYVLAHRDIQAVVSRVPLSEFGQEELEAKLNDEKWLEAKVYVHQSVLERVLASRTLIPMRFCTIYQSERRIEEMLTHHYDHFAQALRRLEGKREWGVKVFCASETLAQRVGELSDRVKELKTETSKKSNGMAYFLEKRLEKIMGEEMERVKDDCAQQSHERLSNHAEEAVINPLHGREITGRQKEMILNGAYLVAEEKLAGFRAALESLREEYGELGYNYELSGPWPPYNFVSLDLGEGAADG